MAQGSAKRSIKILFSLAVVVSNDQGNKWYARSKTIEESDSEDSDGYTEPSEHCNKKSASRLVSSGSLRSHNTNNNNSQYAACIEQSPWQQENKYQALRTKSCSEVQEDTEYLELFK